MAFEISHQVLNQKRTPNSCPERQQCAGRSNNPYSALTFKYKPFLYDDLVIQFLLHYFCQLCHWESQQFRTHDHVL